MAGPIPYIETLHTVRPAKPRLPPVARGSAAAWQCLRRPGRGAAWPPDPPGDQLLAPSPSTEQFSRWIASGVSRSPMAASLGSASRSPAMRVPPDGAETRQELHGTCKSSLRPSAFPCPRAGLPADGIAGSRMGARPTLSLDVKRNQVLRGPASANLQQQRHGR